MVLIGLNGKKGAGKDTAGSYIVEKYGLCRASFAGKLKQSALAALGIIAPDEQSAIDFWEELKNDDDAVLTLSVGGDVKQSITVRQYLQFYGTEAHRDIFGADFWTRMLLDSLDPEEKGYVITDARFTNECSAVRDMGGMIVRIDRPGTDTTDTHASEEDLPDELVDAIVHNSGSISYMWTALDLLMATTLNGGWGCSDS